METVKPLFLILKRKYFEQIKSGEKTEELRSITPYWVNRLVGKNYNSIIFQMGYRKDAPRVEVEYLGHEIKKINHEFFGNDLFNSDEISVFALKLGRIIQ